MQRSEPRWGCEDAEVSGVISALWTGTGIHPPGACVIFASSSPTRRGIDGPVRSMSRIPTDLPCSDKARASWSVTEDLPTPPLPERTYYPDITRQSLEEMRQVALDFCRLVIDKPRGASPAILEGMSHHLRAQHSSLQSEASSYNCCYEGNPKVQKGKIVFAMTGYKSGEPSSGFSDAYQSTSRLQVEISIY